MGAVGQDMNGCEALKALAERIFSLFVINVESIGYQLDDGTYRRRTVPVSPMLIEAMLASGGSMGCYQQQPRTGHIRWLCLDYDCAEKDHPDVLGLYREVIKPVSDILCDMKIQHLLEFSGRRGIHLWVTFGQSISKDVGFRIVNALVSLFSSRIGELDHRWRLDKFPATGSFKGNIVGKQVKFPLSCHRTGRRSFFFKDEDGLKDGLAFVSRVPDSFFTDQLHILESYKDNDPTTVLATLGIDDSARTISRQLPVARRYRVVTVSDIECVSLGMQDFITILSEVPVFGALFERLKRGTADTQDRIVLFGTLSPFEEGTELLRSLLSEFPCFDEKKTESGIARLKERYSPATFGYLYDLYGLPIDPDIRPDDTGFSYLMTRLGKRELLTEITPISNEINTFDATVEAITDTIIRERNYLASNDEVRDAYIDCCLEDYNDLECKYLSEVIRSIEKEGPTGGLPEPDEYRVLRRIESDEKMRELVSLSARDRLLTTHLALRLCALSRRSWDSYSYHAALMSRSRIFFSWYSSWRRYIWQVRCFFDINFFEEYEVFFIDLESYYDHIDFLSVYKAIGDTLDEECRNIFNYLVSFNDKLMSEMHGGCRIGVPQGPAYARIIAEIFLDEVLKRALSGVNKQEIRCYRYVDDMLFVCSPDSDARALFDRLVLTLNSYGLPVNGKKSHYYGAIGELSDVERAELSREDSFNYDLREGTGEYVLVDADRREKLANYIEKHGHEFDASQLGQYFGRNVVPVASERFFDAHYKEIVASKQGRGFHFANFYRFAFESEERFAKIASTDVLATMPIGTVNFSNFINELYLAYKEGKPVAATALSAVESFLGDMDRSALDSHDRVLVEALRGIVARKGGIADVADE